MTESYLSKLHGSALVVHRFDALRVVRSAIEASGFHESQWVRIDVEERVTYRHGAAEVRFDFFVTTTHARLLSIVALDFAADLAAANVVVANLKHEVDRWRWLGDGLGKEIGS